MGRISKKKKQGKKLPLSQAWDYSILTPRQLAELDVWVKFYEEHSMIPFIGGLDYHSRKVTDVEKGEKEKEKLENKGKDVRVMRLMYSYY